MGHTKKIFKKNLKKKLNRTLPLRAKCKYEIVFGKTTDPSNRSLKELLQSITQNHLTILLFISTIS